MFLFPSCTQSSFIFPCYFPLLHCVRICSVPCTFKLIPTISSARRLIFSPGLALPLPLRPLCLGESVSWAASRGFTPLPLSPWFYLLGPSRTSAVSPFLFPVSPVFSFNSWVLQCVLDYLKIRQMVTFYMQENGCIYVVFLHYKTNARPPHSFMAHK